MAQQNTQELKEFLSEVKGIDTRKVKKADMTSEVQIERLLSRRFQNPYDVLQLGSEAAEEELRKQYRALSFLVHPDKCKDSRAPEAFHVVEQAYKTLQDAEKRKIYQRIMREARERTDYERKKENKRRQKSGLPELPEETYENQYSENLQQIFSDIEERKQHYQNLEESSKRRKREELEEKRMKETIRQMTEEEWEKTREERVSNWRKFSSKKSILGTKSSNHQLKAPQIKMEERPANAPKTDTDLNLKPMGINEDYKKKWK